jgi:hypothetical protein
MYVWTLLVQFGHFWCNFWIGFGMHVWTLLVQFLIPKLFFNHFDYFGQIWTGFGMHIWTFFVQFLIPIFFFNHFNYFLTDLDKFWYAYLDTFGATFDTKKNFQPF